MANALPNKGVQAVAPDPASGLTANPGAGFINPLFSNAVPTNSTTPDASEQGFGGPGSLKGNAQTMPNSVNNEVINPGGALSGFLTAMYGGKYQTPDPIATAGAAVSGNLGNLAGIYGLSTGADTAGAAGVQSEYLAGLPDYTGLLSQASSNVGQELQGDVPADVQRNLQTAAAERGVTTGQGPNSANDSASYLQALGLTSLGQMQQGMLGFNQLYQDTPTGPAFNPSSMFVTPHEEQAAQLAANEEAAAPQPQMKIVSNIAGYL